MSAALLHRSSPQPFVEECIALKNRSEAAKYIPRLNVDQRVPYYLKIGCVGSSRLSLQPCTRQLRWRCLPLLFPFPLPACAHRSDLEAANEAAVASKSEELIAMVRQAAASVRACQTTCYSVHSANANANSTFLRNLFCLFLSLL